MILEHDLLAHGALEFRKHKHVTSPGSVLHRKLNLTYRYTDAITSTLPLVFTNGMYLMSYDLNPGMVEIKPVRYLSICDNVDIAHPRCILLESPQGKPQLLKKHKNSNRTQLIGADTHSHREAFTISTNKVHIQPGDLYLVNYTYCQTSVHQVG